MRLQLQDVLCVATRFVPLRHVSVGDTQRLGLEPSDSQHLLLALVHH